jgi:hypothetical protein
MSLPKNILRPLVFLGGAAAVAGAVLFAGYYQFTTADSRYCWTCHKDIWDLYQKSQVHPPALSTCVDCHRDPAELARTGVVAKGAWNLNDNCRKCHEDVPAATDVKRRLIKISHKVHVGDEGCQCTDCHRTVAHDRHPAATNRPTKWTCYVCHVHELEIDGEVSEKNCMRCHYHIPDRPKEKGEGGGGK